MEIEEQDRIFTEVNSEQQDSASECFGQSNQLSIDSLNDQTETDSKKDNESITINSEQPSIITKISKISKRNNQKLKKVEYSYVKIPPQNILINQEFFYCHGDLVIDFKKKDTAFDDRYSAWNTCKLWPVTQINRDSGIFTVYMENKYRPDYTHTENQIQKYKNYPDQEIHNLMSCIEKFVGINKFLTQVLEQHFSVIRQCPKMVDQYYLRRKMLDQQMDPVYKKLNEEGAIFFSSHSGPDIQTNDFLFHKCVFSESLSQILGKSLEELQEMFRRNGAYDYFDFEAQLEILKFMIQEQLKVFDQYQIGNYKIQKDKIPFKKQFKLMTYDDIVFYTNVSFQMIKMSDFTNDNDHAIDFYAGILYFEISPSTLKQIMTIRQQNNEYKNQTEINEQTKGFYEENLEYTIQTEIFKEKFIDLDQNQYKLSKEQKKTCKFKMI